jgi:hypothetical protein
MDMVIRDLSVEIVYAIDEQAQPLGLSRAEFVRRELANVAQRGSSEVTTEDLQVFADRFGDLEAPEVMAGAWD